jgi:hypothetical protein
MSKRKAAALAGIPVKELVMMSFDELCGGEERQRDRDRRGEGSL